jgi:hypothetical protein
MTASFHVVSDVLFTITLPLDPVHSELLTVSLNKQQIGQHFSAYSPYFGNINEAYEITFALCLCILVCVSLCVSFYVCRSVYPP